MVKDIKTGAESYEGLTLKIIERYAGDTHSNYYALVWDNGAAKEVYLGHSGYGWTSTATEDAPELLATWEANEKAARAIAVREEQDLARLAQASERARTPLKGAKVKVVKGRKVPVGTTGEIIWYGETQYGMRVGLVADTADGEKSGDPLWTAADNVEVTTPAPDGAPGPSTLEARVNRPARTYTGNMKKKVTRKDIVLDADGDYRITFPYDPDLREELKSFFSRRRWDKDHTAWIVPGRDRLKVLEFAGKHGFDLTEPSGHLAKVVIDTVSETPEAFEVIAEIEATTSDGHAVTLSGPGLVEPVAAKMTAAELLEKIEKAPTRHARAPAWAQAEVERILAEEVEAELGAQAKPPVEIEEIEPPAPARTPEGWLIVGEATVGTTGGKK
jgi:hypothetical protein